MLRAAFLAVLSSVVVVVVAQVDEPKAANPPARFSFTWKTNAGVLLRGEHLPADAARVFRVHVEQPDGRSAIGLPPINGRYEVTNGAVLFHPQFPFQAGVRYRATFQPPGEKAVTSVFEIPLTQRTPSTVVQQVYPTADLLPENLLKFYLYFSAPMSGGNIYEHIWLTAERGRRVELPFLEIDEELWNRDMTRLTLFLDPGRIKRDVKPLEEVGPALEAGKSYTLTIDHTWLDATGTSLKESFEKKFRVGPADREPPELSSWKITSPTAGTSDPLRIQFSDPMDHALAVRMITVEKISGAAKMDEQERLWLFTPKQPWAAGRYHLRVQTTIEDLAGNNIGKPFEVDLFSGVDKRLTRDFVSREFDVK